MIPKINLFSDHQTILTHTSAPYRKCLYKVRLYRIFTFIHVKIDFVKKHDSAHSNNGKSKNKNKNILICDKYLHNSVRDKCFRARK